MTPAAILILVLANEAEAVDPATHIEVAPLAPRSPVPNVVVPALHGLALMSVMRATETVLWPDPFAKPEQFGARYEEAFTSAPVFDSRRPFMRWDGDPLVVNALGHAVFGSELHLRARQCRFGWAGALAFTAATSALWEYGFEANGARPSALDLVYTPLAGLALGEARFFAYRAASELRSPAARDAIHAVVDPLGEIERAAGADC